MSARVTSAVRVLACLVLACTFSACSSNAGRGDASDTVNRTDAGHQDAHPDADSGSASDTVDHTDTNVDREDARADSGNGAMCMLLNPSPGQTEAIGCLSDSEGNLVATDLTASVAVIDIQDATSYVCAGLGGPPAPSVGSTPVKKLSLSDGARVWTFYARLAGLPGDLVKPGDQVDLTVHGARGVGVLLWFNQTVALSRGSRILLFVSERRGFMGGGLPILDEFGLAFQDRGALCEYVMGCCSVNEHRLGVSFQGQTTSLVPNQTVDLAGLSIRLHNFISPGPRPQCCDGLNPTTVSGYLIQ